MRKKTSQKKSIIKVIQNESYLVFINKVLKNFVTKSTTLIYVGLALFGIAVFWYEDGFENMLKVLMMFINASVILLFLAELISILISKEIDKNNIITELLAIFILILISFIFYDEKFRYWSFVLGLMFFIPLVINIIFNKIRLWLNL